LSIALPRPFPAPVQRGDFLVAAHERREMALSCAPSAAARPNEPEQRHRLRHALEGMAAALLGDEPAGDLALHPHRDHDRARLGQLLRPRCDVRYVAENLARAQNSVTKRCFQHTPTDQCGQDEQSRGRPRWLAPQDDG
jgi:hypothetical protein